jgi:hypothetical protein
MNAAEAIGNILSHHGVKGMKWGVRRKATVGPHEVIVRDTRKKIKTSGGGGHPAHPSAVSARTTGQIAKKSGTKALSDQQLNDYARRIRLEQEVKRLQFNEKGRAAKWVDGFLGRQGSQLANAAARESGTQVGKAALNVATRKSIKVARVAAFA